jgi:hypothetical protein
MCQLIQLMGEYEAKQLKMISAAEAHAEAAEKMPFRKEKRNVKRKWMIPAC